MRHAVVVGVMVGVWASAGRAEAQASFERVWIDLSFGVAAPAEDAFSMDARSLYFEPADFGAQYSLPRGAGFDFGGGVLVTPMIGFGVSFTGTAHEHAANLSLRIPHPVSRNVFASDTAATDGVLEREEKRVNLQAMLVAAQTDRFRLRVFGGPTYFRVEQDAITYIRFDQVFVILPPANSITITGFDSERIEGTGWGLHAGADASVFFNRVVGVGGFARFSRGTVTLENTLATTVDPRRTVPSNLEDVDVRVGGIQVGVGLRLKF
jgi:hypothetical protein